MVIFNFHLVFDSPQLQTPSQHKFIAGQIASEKSDLDQASPARQLVDFANLDNGTLLSSFGVHRPMLSH
jgi:hypothetical protein